METQIGFLYIIMGIVSVIAIISFFLLGHNVRKIRDLLEQERREKLQKEQKKEVSTSLNTDYNKFATAEKIYSEIDKK